MKKSELAERIIKTLGYTPSDKQIYKLVEIAIEDRLKTISDIQNETN